jgi:hypothetical protein
MSDLKPYTLADLLNGAPRVALADPGDLAIDPAPVPADLWNQVKPYTLKQGLFDLGAAKESTTYSIAEDSEEQEIQQETGAVIEEITDVNRTLETSIAGINPENMRIIEEAPEPSVIAATDNTAAADERSNAYDVVDVTGYADHTAYRVLFIATRPKVHAQVLEGAGPGAVARGAFVAYLGYRVTLAAEDRDLEMEKGELAHVPVTFRFYPDAEAPAVANGNAYGRWFFEQPGTIPAGV